MSVNLKNIPQKILLVHDWIFPKNVWNLSKALFFQFWENFQDFFEVHAKIFYKMMELIIECMKQNLQVTITHVRSACVEILRDRVKFDQIFLLPWNLWDC